MADYEIIEHRVTIGELTFNVAEVGSGPAGAHAPRVARLVAPVA